MKAIIALFAIVLVASAVRVIDIREPEYTAEQKKLRLNALRWFNGQRGSLTLKDF